jgi:hypothetical protein
LKRRHAVAIRRPSEREASAHRCSSDALLGNMSTINRFLLVLLLVLVLGGTVFLVTWDIPPPTSRVEHVLPDDQFPR